MTKYIVTFESIGHHTIEIEADTIDKAVEVAQSMREGKHDHSDLEQTECLAISVNSEDGEESSS